MVVADDEAKVSVGMKVVLRVQFIAKYGRLFEGVNLGREYTQLRGRHKYCFAIFASDLLLSDITLPSLSSA